MFIKQSTFVGTGADQTVEVGWTPDVVLYSGITTLTSSFAMHSKEMATGGLATVAGSQFGFTPSGALDLPSFTPTGFVARAAVGVTFSYVAFKSHATNKDVGSVLWSGDVSGDNRNITGLGFQPDFVMVFSNDGNEFMRCWHVDRGGDSSGIYTEVDFWVTNAIQSVSADGFQVGTRFNVNGRSYIAICFKEGPNCEIGRTPTGDGTGDRTITFSNVSQPCFIFSPVAISPSNAAWRAPYRSVSNTNGFGNSIGSGGEATQTWKNFGASSALLDAFYNLTGFICYYMVVQNADANPPTPPEDTFIQTELPYVFSGGGYAILPTAPYNRYKMLRAMGQQLNNLVVGP